MRRRDRARARRGAAGWGRHLIYLASRSPRRRELLAQIGVRFEVLLFREGTRQDADTSEAALPAEQPNDYVRRVTQQKAEAGWQRITSRGGMHRKPVLAADTTVALAGEILAKPADREDARVAHGERAVAVDAQQVVAVARCAVGDRPRIGGRDHAVYRHCPVIT